MEFKHKHILELIDDKLEQKIRNIKIQTAWRVMSDLTDTKYKTKIKILMEQHHLSYSRIEDIINMEDQ